MNFITAHFVITIFQSSFLNLNRTRCTWNSPFSSFNVICQTIKTYNWWRYASLSIILTADNKIRKERKPTKFLEPIHRFSVNCYFGYCKHSLPIYCKIIWKLTSLATIWDLTDFILYPTCKGYLLARIYKEGLTETANILCKLNKSL